MMTSRSCCASKLLLVKSSELIRALAAAPLMAGGLSGLIPSTMHVRIWFDWLMFMSSGSHYCVSNQKPRGVRRKTTHTVTNGSVNKNIYNGTQDPVHADRKAKKKKKRVSVEQLIDTSTMYR